MTTLMFLAAIVMLICLPVYVAIYVFERQQDRMTADYKKRREEEKQYQWLESIGLVETAFYFSPYGMRLLSIWSIRMTAAGIFK